MVSDRIAQLAEDERRRDEVRSRETAAAERRSTLARVHGRRLVEALRAAVTRDVELFRQEFRTTRRAPLSSSADALSEYLLTPVFTGRAR